MECDLLINSHSRYAKKALSILVAELVASGFKIRDTHVVSRKYRLHEAVSILMRRRPALLIIGAGDGTISAVLNRFAGTQVEIGIIPLGTTNNFARSLRIPIDIKEAVQTIAANKGRSVDLGVANGTAFANVASLGISADIARHVSDKDKLRWGRLAYMMVGLKRLWLHRPFVVTIEGIHRNMTVTIETHQLVIANGRYHAGREIAEDAAIDNGQLLVFALGGASRFSLIVHTADFYFGKRRRVIHSSFLAGRNIRIATTTPQSLEIDGEVKKKTPIHASVQTAAVKVRCAP